MKLYGTCQVSYSFLFLYGVYYPMEETWFINLIEIGESISQRSNKTIESVCVDFSY